MKKIRVVFMGTTEFSCTVLKSILKNKNVDVIYAYTKKPTTIQNQHKILKSPLHILCELNHVAVHTPSSLNSTIEYEFLKNINADLAIVAAYGLIIPAQMLILPTYGFINIHASLLPRWRGAAPMQAALLHGDIQTGISIIKMDAGIDTGDIITTKELTIQSKTNLQKLSIRMATLATTMLEYILYDIETALKKAYPQSEKNITYAPRFSKKDCQIHWNEDARQILNKIMAFAPAPGAWTILNGKRFKILDADIYESKNQYLTPFGYINHNMIISCANNTFIKLQMLQQEGKKIMSVSDYLRGHKNIIGNCFEY